MENKIDVGDVVTLLNNYSPLMTVEHVCDHLETANVVWFTEDNQLHRDVFALSCLEKYEGE